MRANRLVGAVLAVGMMLGVAEAQLLPAPPQVPQISSAPLVPSGPPPVSSGPPTIADPTAAPAAQPQQQQGSQAQGRPGNNGGPMAFVGTWCAEGDPAKQTSISYNGAFFNLRNESGSTSIGNLQGNNQIQAPGWQFVTGTLSRDGTQINWSNGTMWARCPTPGYGHRVNLNGTWYPNGNQSLKCSIQDRHGSLLLQKQNGQRASGNFNGKFSITTNWQGTVISGTISRDGNRINWDNGTYWVRYRVYTQ